MQKKNIPVVRKNEQIYADEVIVIDENNSNLGKMHLKNAINLARSKGYDLVEVSSNQNNIITKICDYNKFIYEKNKKKKEQLRQQKENTQELHIIQVSCNIEENDLNHKIKKIQEFIDNNDLVKLVLKLQKIELRNKTFAFDKFYEYLNKVSSFASYQNKPKLNGKTIEVILTKKKD